MVTGLDIVPSGSLRQWDAVFPGRRSVSLVTKQVKNLLNAPVSLNVTINVMKVNMERTAESEGEFIIGDMGVWK